MDAASGEDPEMVQVDIADVKQDIKNVIGKLLDDPDNDYQRVVFFVDDLIAFLLQMLWRFWKR